MGKSNLLNDMKRLFILDEIGVPTKKEKKRMYFLLNYLGVYILYKYI
jgi:hypothetical protein